jgi:hypothetical protein
MADLLHRASPVGEDWPALLTGEGT